MTSGKLAGLMDGCDIATMTAKSQHVGRTTYQTLAASQIQREGMRAGFDKSLRSLRRGERRPCIQTVPMDGSDIATCLAEHLPATLTLGALSPFSKQLCRGASSGKSGGAHVTR